MGPKDIEAKSVRAFFNRLKVSEVMTRGAVSINENERFSLVEEKLRHHNIRHLPVVDNQNRLVGIITQRDLYRVQSPHVTELGNWVYDRISLDMHILKYVMTKEVCTLKPDNTVVDALVLMVHKKYGGIPIVDDFNNLVGIITQVDILRVIEKATA